MLFRSQRNEDGSYTNTLVRTDSCVCDPAATTVPDKCSTPFIVSATYDGDATVTAFLATCLQAAKDAAGIV